jgi:hypothetical protein
MIPYPKKEQTKKPRGRVDWSGFADPKWGKVKLTGSAYTKLKKSVAERDGHRCKVCGETRPWLLNLGHVITKRSKVRKDTPQNTVLECNKCNVDEEDGLLKVDWILKDGAPRPNRIWRRNNPQHEWKRIK